MPTVTRTTTGRPPRPRGSRSWTCGSRSCGPSSSTSALVYFLRKVVWMVPGFTVEGYRPQLAALHRKIEAEGPFVATTTRSLIEARKPG